MKSPKSTVKQSRQKNSAHTEEIKRYIGSLSEEFQHRVSAIGEQFGGLNTKLDEHGKKLDEHGRKLDTLARKVDGHTLMIGRIMEDVEEIKSGMREKVDRNEFVKLEKRMVVLETTVFGGKKRILHK